MPSLTPRHDRYTLTALTRCLRNLGTDFSQATDVYAVAELRNLLVAGLVGGGVDKIDLIAIDIQRQRDVGLGSLEPDAESAGHETLPSFSDLTPDPILQAAILQNRVYDHGNAIDNVDLFIGGLAEKHAPGAWSARLSKRLSRDQFEALRAGDRFFWLNEGFDQATASMIANTTLANLLERNTATPNLQANVFIQADLPPHVRHHAAQPKCLR